MNRAGSVRSSVAFVLRGYKGAVAKLAFTALIEGLAEAMFLIIVTRTAFAITNGNDRIGVLSGWFLPVWAVLLVLVALIAGRVAVGLFTSWQSANVSTRIVARLRRQLSSGFLNCSWPVQQAQRSGSLQELLTTHSEHATSLIGAVTSGVVAYANLVALLGMAIITEPVGALVLVVSVFLLGRLLGPFRSRTKRRARASIAAGMDFAVSVNEISELGLELHVFDVQGEAEARLDAAIERARLATRAVRSVAGATTPVYTGLAYLAVVGALAVVAASNTTSLTSLGATMLVMLRSLTYAKAAQAASIGVLSTTPAIEEAQRQLEFFDLGRRVDGGAPLQQVGAIAMENVTFAYAPGEAVLRDISFSIMPQEIVGVVGPSGAGKSTLVQLLLGLRDPDGGRVLAGGHPISSFQRADWARKVTFVPQAAHLVAGTIADNIRFLREGVTQAEIERAARLAHLHEDISRFPEGYDRQVGEKGGHLSGGQQQRLCIARALVEQPEVLILDEPTSALDGRSEQLIRETLLGLKDRMTVILIAHRPSTLTVCDRIMVIKDGELKAFGTPSQLEDSSEFYREALTLSGSRAGDLA